MRPWTALPVAALLALGTAGCDSSSPTAPNPVAIEQNLTETLETASFVYHYSPGDAVDPDRQQAFHAWAVAELRVTPPRIDYFKYRNRDQMARLTGRSANGWADPDAFAVHSVFTWHSHETVHLYTALIGRPSDFFNEGIAVAMSVDPLAGDFEPTYAGGLSVHDWARGRGAGLPSIPSIVTTADFRAVDEATGYQTAGSFMAFLLSEYGADALRAFLAAGTRDDSRSRIESSFRAAYGFELAEAERRWRGFLGVSD